MPEPHKRDRRGDPAVEFRRRLLQTGRHDGPPPKRTPGMLWACCLSEAARAVATIVRGGKVLLVTIRTHATSAGRWTSDGWCYHDVPTPMDQLVVILAGPIAASGNAHIVGPTAGVYWSIVDPKSILAPGDTEKLAHDAAYALVEARRQEIESAAVLLRRWRTLRDENVRPLVRC